MWALQQILPPPCLLICCPHLPHPPLLSYPPRLLRLLPPSHLQYLLRPPFHHLPQKVQSFGWRTTHGETKMERNA